MPHAIFSLVWRPGVLSFRAVPALAHHLVLRLENDRTLAETTAARRGLAQAVLDTARPFPLLAFCWVDTHGHGVVVADRAEAGECARRIEIALALTLSPGVAFAPARIRPIHDAAHLRNTFLYVAGQGVHHGTNADPWFDASNVPDLLGARVTGAWTVGHVRTHLPRVRRADVLGAAGLADPDAAPLVFGDLADAAAAAVAREHLRGNDAILVRARTAAAHLARSEGSAVIADALGITTRAARRLLAQEQEPALLRAIRQQLGLRATVPFAGASSIG